MKSARRSAWLKFSAFFLVLIVLSFALYSFGPQEIVEKLGIHNSLLVAGLVSLLGGVSTLTSASFFAVIGSLAVGGVPVGMLMLVCGPALLLGDLVFYWFGKTTHGVLPKRWQQTVSRLDHIRKPGQHALMQLGIIIYTGFTPFPGDVLMVFLAIIKYPFPYIIPALLLGNMLLVWSIAQVALGGSTVLGGLF